MAAYRTAQTAPNTVDEARDRAQGAGPARGAGGRRDRLFNAFLSLGVGVARKSAFRRTRAWYRFAAPMRGISSR